VCLENPSFRWAIFSFVTEEVTLVNEKVTLISCVIAGLDSAIHGASPRVERVSMDHRGKPGGDEEDQRIDWPRLIRSQNVGGRSIMAQTPQA
jgi:hypothetical protein